LLSVLGLSDHLIDEALIDAVAHHAFIKLYAQQKIGASVAVSATGDDKDY
jgi:hypothetical protein